MNELESLCETSVHRYREMAQSEVRDSLRVFVLLKEGFGGSI